MVRDGYLDREIETVPLGSSATSNNDDENSQMVTQATALTANGNNQSPSSTSAAWSPSGSAWRDFLHFCGPGWLVSIAYVDPGNYQADIHAGSTSQYSLLFAVWWTSILSLYVQILCVRLAYYGNLNLAEAMAHGMPRLRYLNWFISEFMTILTDLPEVIGIGIAGNIFFGWPYYVGVVLSLITTMLFLATQKYGIRVLECIICLLVGIMSVAVWAEMNAVGVDQAALARGWAIGFVDLSSKDIFALTGILGSVVMPHNLFLHTASCQSRTVHADHTSAAVKWGSLEPIAPVIVSFFVNMAIMAIAAGRIFGTPGADSVGLTDFHVHFERFGQILWGVALLAAGQSSAITTTYTGQAVMNGFLDLPLAIPVRAIVTRLVTITPCILVSVLLPTKMNQLVNIVNSSLSFLLPFAFSPLVRYNCSISIMGDRASQGLELKLLYAFAGLVWAINSLALSIEGGGFFGDVPRTGGSVLLEICVQVFYVGWNLYCFAAPIPELMDPGTANESNTEVPALSPDASLL